MPRQSVTDSFPNFTGRLLDKNRFKLLEPLGSGAYGKVYRAVDLRSHTDNPRYYAVKCLLKPAPGSRQEEFQTREFALQEKVSVHPNVVSLHRLYEDHTYIYVLLDLCNGGDLFTAITERRAFQDDDLAIKSVFTQIIDAVHYCHENSVFHRDLKPENVLCSSDGEVRLADFGLSTDFRISGDYGCGSSCYMSPECVGKEFRNGKLYSTRHSDIWSLGVILVNMISGRNPWRAASTVDECFKSFLHDNDFLMTVLPLSDAANVILKRIFHLNPLCRITLPELREEILKIDTFFSTSEDVSAAYDGLEQRAAHHRQPAKAPDQLKETYLAPPQSTSSSSVDQSDGLITPETRPVDPDIEVSEMPLDTDAPIKPSTSFLRAAAVAPMKKLVEHSTKHRAPSGSALKPPPRRVGKQLLKKAFRSLKALSENISS